MVFGRQLRVFGIGKLPQSLADRADFGYKNLHPWKTEFTEGAEQVFS